MKSHEFTMNLPWIYHEIPSEIPGFSAEGGHHRGRGSPLWDRRSSGAEMLGELRGRAASVMGKTRKNMGESWKNNDGWIWSIHGGLDLPKKNDLQKKEGNRGRCMEDPRIRAGGFSGKLCSDSIRDLVLIHVCAWWKSSWNHCLKSENRVSSRLASTQQMFKTLHPPTSNVDVP